MEEWLLKWLPLHLYLSFHNGWHLNVEYLRQMCQEDSCVWLHSSNDHPDKGYLGPQSHLVNPLLCNHTLVFPKFQWELRTKNWSHFMRLTLIFSNLFFFTVTIGAPKSPFCSWYTLTFQNDTDYMYRVWLYGNSLREVGGEREWEREREWEWESWPGRMVKFNWEILDIFTIKRAFSGQISTASSLAFPRVSVIEQHTGV